MKPRKGIACARGLRSASTDAELLLWKYLRGRRFGDAKFRRQFPIAGFVADFACLNAKLIVEFDGGQHADRVTQDSNRTSVLHAHGFRVLRFWNNDVLMNTDSVLMEISAALSAPPSPQPSPASGRGG
jgi:adenine-specific DNA-methyltransferase